MSRKILLAAAIAACSFNAHAVIVDHGLTGTTQYDGWDPLGGLADGTNYGFNFGTFSAQPFPTLGSNEAGSGDAGLDRTAGGHYSATSGLYSFQGPSSFSVADSTVVAGLETIILSIKSTDGALGVGLNYNGGAQSLAADNALSIASVESVVIAGGPGAGTTVYDAYIYQWDVTGLGVTDFDIDFSVGSSVSLRNIQLDQGDVFATAVPVPAAAWLFASGLAGLVAARRKQA